MKIETARRTSSALFPRRTGLVLALALAASSPVRAQAQLDWIAPTSGVAVGVDSADNVFTATYAQALGAEMAVTKRDVDGNLLWEASIDQTNATAWERASWLAVDGVGDVVVSGTLMSGFSNPVEAASVLVKFSSNGTPLWRIVYESAFDGSSTRRCLVDAQNDIYVVGIGNGPDGLRTTIKKFTPSGAPVWTWLDPTGIGAPVHAKFTPDGAILVSCRGITGIQNGHAKVGLDGSLVWSLAVVQSPTVGDAAGDAFGNTYVVHGNPAATGSTIVRKLDAAGALLWQNAYAGSGLRVEVGTDDRPIVSGLPPAGAGAAFFKVAPDGALAWSNLDADGPLNLLLHSHMTLDAANNAYLSASTLFQMAVCKIGADGTSGWTLTTAGSNTASIVTGHVPGSVFVTGGQTARIVEPNPDVQSFCTSAPNSAGAGAVMSYMGSLGIAANDFTLRVTGSVPGSVGRMLYGSSAVQIPFGDGFRCIGTSGSGVFRLPPPIPSDVLGTATRRLDFTLPPASSGAGAIAPGSTWKFQWHYRDLAAGMSGFNLSDGLSVTFHP